ncbi:MAG: acyltransferase [Rhodoferax sp.]|uniref:acyltransferase family protein n=1 Tax=Rhodoferax sp. TaxID=50421 RepID=UPI00271745A8|nr:acyltransferase [Rhodoferax sp.]MDO8450887.1 acyltransferase [Rhodoferax sp.]
MTQATGTIAAPDSQRQAAGLPLALSLYLDLVRFLAALCVFITHAKYPRFTDGWLDSVGRYGSDAVMIFFVLSGLVIAHVTQTKERDIETYAVARLARLWSVALPALLLSFVADSVGRRLYPPIYDGPWYQGDHAALRLLANAVFQGQSWFANLLPFTNTPYWSLGYEFWYYVIFAAGHFLNGPVRWAVLALCCALCGPKILLLLPIWLLGVGVYHFARTRQIPVQLGWLLWIGSFVAYALYQSLGLPGYLLWRTVQWLGKPFVIDQLVWSKDFFGNYVVGLLVAANFVGFWRICGTFGPLLQRFQRPIQFLAGFTFSVYLFHMPLLHFFGALIQHDAASPTSQTFILLSTLVGVLLLGLVTEQKKSVARRWITVIFHWSVPRHARR